MTNEEHITNLSVLWERCREAKEFPATMYKLSDGQYLESLEAAIQALEAQEQAIKEAYDKGYEYGVKEWFDKRTKAQTCIEDYPTCTECEHYDSEKHYCPRFCQVIKDTLAEAQPSDITWVVGNDGAQVAFRNMPVDKAQQICAIIGDEVQPTNAVSREAVEEMIKAEFPDRGLWELGGDVDSQIKQTVCEVCVDLLQGLGDLPSVKPKYTDEEIDKAQAVEQAYVDKMVELAVEETKRPKGKWIEVDVGQTIYKCTECGMRVVNPYSYCPNCGAEMSGEMVVNYVPDINVGKIEVENEDSDYITSESKLTKV